MSFAGRIATKSRQTLLLSFSATRNQLATGDDAERARNPEGLARQAAFSDHMDLKLTGKTALVTGSSAGIGFAIAARLASEGVRVAICGRSSK